jgi:hypothetical protein
MAAHKRYRYTLVLLTPLAIAVLSAPLEAQELKVVPRPQVVKQVVTPVVAMPDFGPLEDGKEKSHDSLVKQGWIYIFDSRVPDPRHAWDPMGLWRIRNPGQPQRNLWSVIEEDGERILRNTVRPGQHGSDLISLQQAWNFDLHVELRVPDPSNSGVYLRGRYEIQITSTPADPEAKVGKGGLGGIYNVAAPLTNASKGPGVWQTIDASIRGFQVTVRLNGKVIHRQVEIPENRRRGTGSELGEGDGVSSDPSSPGPVFLQGDHGSVDFRNIRIRPARSPMRIRKAAQIQPRLRVLRPVRVKEAAEKKESKEGADRKEN